MTPPTSERQDGTAPAAAPAQPAPQAGGASAELSEEVTRLVEERVAEHAAALQPARLMMTVAGWSLVLAIPISAFAALNAGVLGLGIAWLGIVAVNGIAATIIRRR